VLCGLNESLMPLVKQGEIDFALSSVPRRAQDPDLLHETLFTECAVVVARADHPLARRRQGALSPASRFVMECLRGVAAQHF
jgi:DNA-binding transcriptional LysR family regulator